MTEAFPDSDLPKEQFEMQGIGPEVIDHAPRVIDRTRFVPYASVVLGEFNTDGAAEETMAVPAKPHKVIPVILPRPPIKPRGGRTPGGPRKVVRPKGK